MITLRLSLENISGEWFGWIENMPGCYCRGASPEEARLAAGRAAADYIRWLGRHSEPPSAEFPDSMDLDFVVEIAETYSALLDDLQLEPTAFFSSDALTIGQSEVNRMFRLLRYARADLIAAVSALPPDDWETAPLGEKSIRAVLAHLGDSEMEILRVYGIEPPLPSGLDPLTFLCGIRAAFETGVLARAPSDGAVRLGAMGERWSLRKALRFLLWHERFHTAQIAARSNPRAFLDEISHAVIIERRDGARSAVSPERRSSYSDAAHTPMGKENYY